MWRDTLPERREYIHVGSGGDIVSPTLLQNIPPHAANHSELV
jgi:hypothetical protein